MSNSALEAIIREHCRELKLAAFQRKYPALCRRARQGGGQPYEELLRKLPEAEVRSRHNSTARRLLREARFPDIKTLDQVDWTALKGISKPKLLELAICQFITAAQSTIIAGPIGTANTMLAIASRSRRWRPGPY
jgi:DNA replication protein DnaC